MQNKLASISSMALAILATNIAHAASEAKGPLAPVTAQNSVIHEEECINGFAGESPCLNIDLLTHFDFDRVSANPASAADVWGFVDLNSNREYAIVGFDIGTAVFDVTDPDDPREIGFIDGQLAAWRDIKVYQYWNGTEQRWNAFAYITTDGAADGLVIVDLRELPQRVSRVNFSSNEFTEAHNAYVTNTDSSTGLSLTGETPTLIIAGSDRVNGDGRFLAYDLTDAAAPQFIAMPPVADSGYMHDAASMTITDNRRLQCAGAVDSCEVLFDFNETSIDLWNITDPAAPELLSSTGSPIPVPDPDNLTTYVHSGWPTEDKQFLFVNDELDESSGERSNTTLRIYSLADLQVPTLVQEWSGPTAAIDHNGFVRGNRYYLANYTRGLTILDITDPAAPQEVGFFDTYPDTDAAEFSGAWGTYPYFHSGSIAVSDLDSGFYMLEEHTRDVPEGRLAFTAKTYGGEESSTAALQIPVSRLDGSTGAVSVAYEIVPATADSNDASASGVLSWAAGESVDKLITLDLAENDDGTGALPMERLLIRLISPQGGATLDTGASVASVYVSDAGQPSVVEFSAASITTAEKGFGTAVVVFQRTGSAVGAVSVNYSRSDGDVESAVDFFVASSGTVNWADGDGDPKWIEIPFEDDGVDEPDEFLELSLSNATGSNVSIGARSVVRIDILDGTGINNAPSAVAGTDQSVSSSASVTLNGSQSSDPDGDTLTYQWEQTAGPTVTLGNATAATATFTAPTVSADTLLQFSLTVSDDGGQSDISSTSVTVRMSAIVNTSSGGGGSIGWLVLLMLLVFANRRSLKYQARPHGQHFR